MTSIPSRIHLNKQSQTLELHYGDAHYALDAEYLRVLSPSAEVRGHGGEGAKLVYGKKDVRILKVEPAGNYAIKLHFDDGHDSGLYTWEYLFKLATEHALLWGNYLDQLHTANKSREKDSQVVNIMSQ